MERVRLKQPAMTAYHITSRMCSWMLLYNATFKLQCQHINRLISHASCICECVLQAIIRVYA